MAKVTTQRKTRRSGTSAQGTVTFHVTGGETLGIADFQFPANDGTGDTLLFVPRFIDYVINTGTTAVTIDGKSYGPGSWNFYQTGGIPTTAATIVVGSGNIVIQLRS